LFRIVDRPLVLDEVVRAVSGPGRGGVVTLTGAVRDETRGKRVVRLEYEAYAPMAEKVLEELGEEIAGKWPGALCAIVHRVGTLVPGELAVVIAVAAPHRAAAFEGCRHAIERLKADAPIWKREVYEDGAVWVGLGP
jgi:molybdopterin synthase catalytic subunit